MYDRWIFYGIITIKYNIIKHESCRLPLKLSNTVQNNARVLVYNGNSYRRLLNLIKFS